MKTAKKLLCLVLVSVMLLSISSCKSKNQSEETPPASTSNVPVGTCSEVVEEGSGDKYIVSSNKFRIIYGDGESADVRSLGASALYNLIYDRFGVRMEIESDFNNPAEDFEILVGNTNRDGNVDTSSLTYYDYGWSFDGKTVRIYGGSADALNNAVKRFADKYYDEANKGLVVTTGASMKATYSYPYTSITVEGKDVASLSVAARNGYDAAANEVYRGFGKLCGVKMSICVLNDGEAKPIGDYVYVGFDECEGLNMTYAMANGSLNFMGNGLLGGFNQLDSVVIDFFKKHFPNTDTKILSLEGIIGDVYLPEFENMIYAEDSFVSKLDKSFEDGKKAILDAASDYKVTGSGKTYYVSSSTGDDSNDGLSPEKAWKTLEKVNSTSVNAGSVILFKRGDVWNRQGELKIKNGVTFSAYGSGEKPMVSNYIDASLASDWTKVGDDLYVYSGAYESGTPMDYQNNDVSAKYPNNETLAGSYITSTNYDVISNDDIGNIIFNDGDGWGVKITKYNDSDLSINIGTVKTGFGTLTHNSKTFSGQNDLSQHLEFYHNPTESRLYLYCDGGNPADVFKNIKLVLRGYLVTSPSNQVAKDVCIDNLAVKYVGCHGIATSMATNLTIQNCEIGWIGGSIQTYDFGGRTSPTRFGEGIQNWGSCDGFYIKNNYIYQIYDGATSSQQSVSANLSSILMTDAEVSGNCFEYNSASIEFWFNIVEEQADNDNFKLSNWNMSGNMIRRAGYGFGSTRPDDADSVLVNGTALHDSFGWPKPKCENIQFTDNTMWDNAGCILEGLGWNTKMFNMSDNIIVHEYGTIFGVLARDFDHGAQWDIAQYKYDSETIALLIEKM